MLRIGGAMATRTRIFGPCRTSSKVIVFFASFLPAHRLKGSPVGGFDSTRRLRAFDVGLLVAQPSFDNLECVLDRAVGQDVFEADRVARTHPLKEERNASIRSVRARYPWMRRRGIPNPCLRGDL